jgi:hypothetical protein
MDIILEIIINKIYLNVNDILKISFTNKQNNILVKNNIDYYINNYKKEILKNKNILVTKKNNKNLNINIRNKYIHICDITRRFNINILKKLFKMKKKENTLKLIDILNLLYIYKEIHELNEINEKIIEYNNYIKNMNAKIATITNNDKDIEFLKKYIIEKYKVDEDDLELWKEYITKNKTDKKLYNIDNFSDFIIEKRKEEWMEEIREKIYEIETDIEYVDYLEELIFYGYIKEEDLKKWKEFKIFRNKYLKYKDEIDIDFEKYLENDGDSIILDIIRLKKEKKLKKKLEKYNLEMRDDSRTIQAYLEDDDITDKDKEERDEVVRVMREMDFFYNKTSYKELYEIECRSQELEHNFYEDDYYNRIDKISISKMIKKQIIEEMKEQNKKIPKYIDTEFI